MKFNLNVNDSSLFINFNNKSIIREGKVLWKGAGNQMISQKINLLLLDHLLCFYKIDSDNFIIKEVI